MPNYYTTTAEVPLEPGQTLAFTTGKGYYAAGTPTPTRNTKETIATPPWVDQPVATPAATQPKPAATVAYDPQGYVPGGSSAKVAQAIEAQAIATPGPTPTYVPVAIEKSIPPTTLVTSQTGQVETLAQPTATSPALLQPTEVGTPIPRAGQAPDVTPLRQLLVNQPSGLPESPASTQRLAPITPLSLPPYGYVESGHPIQTKSIPRAPSVEGPLVYGDIPALPSIKTRRSPTPTSPGYQDVLPLTAAEISTIANLPSAQSLKHFADLLTNPEALAETALSYATSRAAKDITEEHSKDYKRAETVLTIIENLPVLAHPFAVIPILAKHFVDTTLSPQLLVQQGEQRLLPRIVGRTAAEIGALAANVAATFLTLAAIASAIAEAKNFEIHFLPRIDPRDKTYLLNIRYTTTPGVTQGGLPQTAQVATQPRAATPIIVPGPPAYFAPAFGQSGAQGVVVSGPSTGAKLNADVKSYIYWTQK